MPQAAVSMRAGQNAVASDCGVANCKYSKRAYQAHPTLIPNMKGTAANRQATAQ